MLKSMAVSVPDSRENSSKIYAIFNLLLVQKALHKSKQLLDEFETSKTAENFLGRTLDTRDIF